MKTKKIEVTNEEGLHTRPANSFVKTVREFESEIRLAKGEVEVPGKSLLKLMKLGIVKGDEVRLICDGPDEDDAMAKLTALLQPTEAHL